MRHLRVLPGVAAQHQRLGRGRLGGLEARPVRQLPRRQARERADERAHRTRDAGAALGREREPPCASEIAGEGRRPRGMEQRDRVDGAGGGRDREPERRDGDSRSSAANDVRPTVTAAAERSSSFDGSIAPASARISPSRSHRPACHAVSVARMVPISAVRGRGARLRRLEESLERLVEGAAVEGDRAAHERRQRAQRGIVERTGTSEQRERALLVAGERRRLPARDQPAGAVGRRPVSSAARSSAADAAAWPARARARSAVRSSSAAAPSSVPRTAAARCHAWRSAYSSPVSTSASAWCARARRTNGAP